MTDVGHGTQPRSRLAGFVRWLGALVPDDPGAAKAMALLGPAAYGQPCTRCGKRDWRGMHPRHYAYANRIALKNHGKPFCKLAGVCQCGPQEIAA